MSAEPILDVRNVSMRFGGVVALDSLSFSVQRNEICGLIGPNGAGKTTLFNVVSRVYQPSTGEIWFEGNNIVGVAPHSIARLGIARTFQNLALFPSLTLLENVMAGAHSRGRVGFIRGVFRWGTRKEEQELRELAASLLGSLGLDEWANEHAKGLPFGTLKRLELARALASNPRLLLLDEPASGLAHGEVDELAQTIARVRKEFNLTILLVEHHMGMVMGISDTVVALDFGRRIAQGVPAAVREDPAVIEAYLGSAS